VSALGHYIEDEGIATTGISLVREHTVGMRPPRFLWVPFELGRPLGAPNNPDFQMKVLRESLALLASDEGPVLLCDFDEDAPLNADENEEECEGWTCPVNLPAPPSDASDRETALVAEMASLASWYDVAKRKRGGSSVGASSLPIDQAARALIGYLEGNRDNPVPEIEFAEALKLASEDIKAWYMEAATAQPGSSTSKQIADWFWGETTVGSVFLDLHGAMAASDDPKTQILATRSFIPRSQAHRLKQD
jgi:hypothetical protein